MEGSDSALPAALGAGDPVEVARLIAAGADVRYRRDGGYATGEMPGWIYGHRATPISAHEIRVSGGELVTLGDDGEVHVQNTAEYVLDVERLLWRRAS